MRRPTPPARSARRSLAIRVGRGETTRARPACPPKPLEVLELCGRRSTRAAARAPRTTARRGDGVGPELSRSGTPRERHATRLGKESYPVEIGRPGERRPSSRARHARPEQRTDVALVFFPARRPLARDEIVECDDAHRHSVPRHALCARMSLREIDAGNASENVHTRRWRAQEEKLVRFEALDLKDDARRRAVQNIARRKK